LEKIFPDHFLGGSVILLVGYARGVVYCVMGRYGGLDVMGRYGGLDVMGRYGV
jgi:hypothetical protein